MGAAQVIGTVFAEEYTVKSVSKNIDRYSKPYLKVVMTDGLYTEYGYVFKECDQVLQKLETGSEVVVWGQKNNINNMPAIKIDKISVKQRTDLQAYREKLIRFCREFADGKMNFYLALFLEDEEFMNAFCSAPGSLKGHHAFDGGLMAHTYECMLLAAKMAEVEPYASKIDKVAFVMRVFLHDVGKIFAYEGSNGKYRLTKDGQHIGQVALGYSYVAERLNFASIFMGERYTKVVNMIMSHHGAIQATFTESKMLKRIDEMNSEAGA